MKLFSFRRDKIKLFKQFMGESVDSSKIKQMLDKLPRIPMGDEYIGTRSVGMEVFTGMVRLPPRFQTLLKKAPIEQVNISDIISAQGYLMIEKVVKLVDTPTNNPITLLRQDGKLIMTDGNHRLAAAMLTKKKVISAKILDAGPIKKR